MPWIQYYYIYLGSGCGRAKAMFLSQFVLVTLLVDMQAGLQARRRLLNDRLATRRNVSHASHHLDVCRNLCSQAGHFRSLRLF